MAKIKTLAINKQWELWLPEPQERVVLPPLPGKKDDGKLWFEGPRKQKNAEQDIDRSYTRLAPDPTSLPMRDVRKGDKWLPWHFKEEKHK